MPGFVVEERCSIYRAWIVFDCDRRGNEIRKIPEPLELPSCSVGRTARPSVAGRLTFDPTDGNESLSRFGNQAHRVH